MCPKKGKGDGKPTGSGKVSLFADSEKAGEVHKSNFCIQGKLDGQSVPMLVDTGCTHTLVRSNLESLGKIGSLSRVKVRCCHGDVKSYPTATVKLDVRGVEHCVVAGVLAQLPQPVLLGQDIDVAVLHSLVQKDVDACLVLTREGRQAVQAENVREDEAGCESGAEPTSLLEVDCSDDQEFCELAKGLDEGLFQGDRKTRKSHKQRQLAKRMWNMFSKGSGEDTTPPQGIISWEELKRLQHEDTSLGRIREM